MLLIILFLVCMSSCNGSSGGKDKFVLSNKPWLSHPHIMQQKPSFNGCETHLVPSPARNNGISKYIINLDLPPEERWSRVVTDKRSEILSLLATVRESSDEWFGKKLFDLLDEYLPRLARTLPEPFYQEIRGMASAINVTVGEATLFNVFYEFFSVCTSIVYQTAEGRVYHARNMDFGLLMGWDIGNRTWLTTERLRPLVVELDFQRNNKTVFKSASFAGFLGVLTGIKPGSFSLTINERFKLNGGYVGVIEWIFGLRRQQWVGYLTRSVMEGADTYTQAQKMLSKAPLVSPVYFILAGTKPYQGCVITRGRQKFDIRSLAPSGPSFLVQTNYDHWTQPPFYDDRRTPAELCMTSVDLHDPRVKLFNVLSTRPVLNKLTVYTTVMQAGNASMDTWLQDCADPCWPW